MPWALLVRWVVRLAAGLLFWRVVTSRRGAYAPGAPPVRGRPPTARRIDPRAAALAIRGGLSLGWRITAALTLLAFASLLLDAGVSLVVLSPRWLGAVLLGLAVLTMAALYVEARALWRVIASRRRRQHDEQLRKEV